MEAFITVTDLSRSINGQVVLQPISFTVPRGARLVIAGETGSGKSSLLKLIGGLAQPASGSVRIGNKTVIGPDDQLLPGHPGVAYLSQHFELRNNYRVEELIEAAARVDDEAVQRICRICEVEHLLKRRTDQLSGGERQRIATALLLVGGPELLLLDEPFTNLDRTHKQVMRTVIDGLSEELGLTIILVSHDPVDILPWATEMLVLHQGRLVQHGSAKEIYHNPVDAYTAGLLGPFTQLSIQQALALHWEDPQRPLRPEQVQPATDGAPATVLRSQFFGPYYLHEAHLRDGIVLFQSTEAYGAGDVVRLKA